MENDLPAAGSSLFRGRSEHLLDAKGRLNIPARFQEVLRRSGSDLVMITNWDKCLRAFTVPAWERQERDLVRLRHSDPETDRYIRYIITGLTECPMDRQGRILLPPSLRQPFGIDKDVVLAGMLESFEIWSRESFAAEWQAANESFSSLASKVAADRRG
ncbi:MAG: division/cell wall cluster transcriptional repressor MraZ [Thermodesulfobacteriota bacterium]